MSHSKNAAVAAAFSATQFCLSLVSGILLFPLVVKSVGSFTYGLWLATGESIAYVLLGDFGVFAVLPWLISGRLGAKDLDSVRRLVSNALAIGCSIGMLLGLAALAVFSLDHSFFGIEKGTWNAVVYPTTLLLVLNGICYPFRVGNACLVGVQDVYATGIFSILQSALFVAFTILMITSQSGMYGLSLAAGVPQVVVAILASFRIWWRHGELISELKMPSFKGCLHLFQEGFGAWLGGLGFRVMVASNSIILAGVGKPEWASIFASTGKISQITSSICTIIPDSGMVGLSHIYAEKDQDRTRRSVVCLLLLYLIVPTLAAIGLLVVNPAFVNWWMGAEFYAGSYINSLISIQLIVASIAGGCVKLPAVVGKRQVVGYATLVGGIAYGFLGYIMVRYHGLAGLAESGNLVWLFVIFPVGIYLIYNVYHVQLSDVIQLGLFRWIAVTIPFIVLASFLGAYLENSPILAFCISLLLMIAYCVGIRKLLADAPWPARIATWLVRMHLVAPSIKS